MASPLRVVTAFIVILGFADVGAAAPLDGVAPPLPDANETLPLDDEMAAVRRSYVELRRDMLVADPSAIVPAGAQVAIYVSMDPQTQATLDAVSITVDGREICQQHYADREVGALKRGGADRLYVGSLPANAQMLAATFAGVTHDGKRYSVTTNVDLPATELPRYVELQLAHTSTKGQPDIVAHVSS